MSRTPVRALVVLILALSVAATSGQPAPARLAPTTISVIVERGDGTYVTDLSREDFAVSSDGINLPIDFVRPDEVPLTLLLLLDTTVSVERVYDMTQPRSDFSWSSFSRAIERSLVEGLRPVDRLRVGSLATTLKTSERFTADRQELARSLSAATTRDAGDRHGPAPLWDAGIEVLSVLAEEPGRRALILFTDGEATNNASTVEEVVADANRLGIAVHVISVAIDRLFAMRGNGNDRAAMARPSRALRYLADQTGGLFLPADYRTGRERYIEEGPPDGYAASQVYQLLDRQNQVNPWPPGRPEAAFMRALHGLRARYEIGLQMGDGPTQARTLDVRVTRPGVTVRAQKSFVPR